MLRAQPSGGRGAYAAALHLARPKCTVLDAEAPRDGRLFAPALARLAAHAAAAVGADLVGIPAMLPAQPLADGCGRAAAGAADAGAAVLAAEPLVYGRRVAVLPDALPARAVPLTQAPAVRLGRAVRDGAHAVAAVLHAEPAGPGGRGAAVYSAHATPAVLEAQPSPNHLIAAPALCADPVPAVLHAEPARPGVGRARGHGAHTFGAAMLAAIPTVKRDGLAHRHLANAAGAVLLAEPGVCKDGRL